MKLWYVEFRMKKSKNFMFKKALMKKLSESGLSMLFLKINIFKPILIEILNKCFILKSG